MKGYTLILTLNDVMPSIIRKITIPEKITFQKLHEIIQIIYGFKKIHHYKFTFKDFSINIKETKSINPDNIDAKYELIDYYFKAYDSIGYNYNPNVGWNINIKVIENDNVSDYPQIITSSSKYNPFEECLIVNDLTRLIKLTRSHEELPSDLIEYQDYFKPFNRIKTQQELMKLFSIDTKIINHHIEQIKIDPNYSLDDYLEK